MVDKGWLAMIKFDQTPIILNPTQVDTNQLIVYGQKVSLSSIETWFWIPFPQLTLTFRYFLWSHLHLDLDQYRKKKHNFRSLEPILRTHPVSGEMEYIRYNANDRAPIRTVPPEHIDQYYKALIALSQKIEVKEAIMTRVLHYNLG